MFLALLYKIYFSFIIFPTSILFLLMGKKVIYRTVTLFFGKKEISILQFNSSLFIVRWLHIPLYLLEGDLLLVGGFLSDTPYVRAKNGLKAGVFSLYSLRLLSHMPNLDCQETEQEYMHKRDGFYQSKLIMKIVLNFFVFGTYKESKIKKTIQLFDIPMQNISKDELIKKLKTKEKKTFFFVNAENINQSFKSRKYKKILKANPLNLIDGSGISLACRYNGIRVKENLNGTDLFPHLIEYAIDKKLKVYFLGSSQTNLNLMIDKLSSSYPELEVVGRCDGYFNHSESENKIDMINHSGADFLFVGMGTPLQENWVEQNREALKVNTIFTVGGLFDFVSGQKRRAPLFLRELGLEWTFRLFIEPRRMFKRYVVGNVLFLCRVILLHSRSRSKESVSK